MTKLGVEVPHNFSLQLFKPSEYSKVIRDSAQIDPQVRRQADARHLNEVELNQLLTSIKLP